VITATMAAATRNARARGERRSMGVLPGYGAPYGTTGKNVGSAKEKW
jgi:hypothetical protein